MHVCRIIPRVPDDLQSMEDLQMYKAGIREYKDMENAMDLLLECKLEAVAHKRQNLLRTTTESTSVADAVKILREGNILSIPVVDDSNGQFCGVFSVADLFRRMVKDLKWDHAEETFSAVETEAKIHSLYRMPVNSLMHSGELWYIQGQEPSVLDALQDMLQRGQVHHRLFTCNNIKDTSPTGILSQSDVVQLMWDHKVELSHLLSKTVEELGLCAAAAECVDSRCTLRQVLSGMFIDHKTCMGITHNGELVGNLSISDLRQLYPDHINLLNEPVAKFLLMSRGITVDQNEDIEWGQELKRITLHVVNPASTFETVLETLVENHLHRVYVLNDSEQSIGIITLTDVLRQALPQEHAPTPVEGPAGQLPHSSELPEGTDMEPVSVVPAH